MNTEHDAGPVWWPSPYGSGRCLLCPVPAEVVVVNGRGEEADMCAVHSAAAARLSGGRIRAVRAVDEEDGDG